MEGPNARPKVVISLTAWIGSGCKKSHMMPLMFSKLSDGDFPMLRIAQKSYLRTYCNGRLQGTRMNDAILSILFIASSYSINGVNSCNDLQRVLEKLLDWFDVAIYCSINTSCLYKTWNFCSSLDPLIWTYKKKKIEICITYSIDYNKWMWYQLCYHI